jgi:hypothetical protein
MDLNTAWLLWWLFTMVGGFYLILSTDFDRKMPRCRKILWIVYLWWVAPIALKALFQLMGE